MGGLGVEHYLDFEVESRQGRDARKAKAVGLAAFDIPDVGCAAGVAVVAADGGRLVFGDFGAVVASTTLE